MNTDDMYPVCTILYKAENSDGWYYAVMSGSEKECKKECEKLKKQNNWQDYECYESSRYVIKRDIPFQNTMPEVHYLHQCTALIYNPFNNKFYYPEETMPYPETRKRTINNFNIVVKGEGEDDDVWEPDDIDDFEGGTDIAISFNNQKDKIITIAEDIVKVLPKFIKRLQKTGYSNLSNEEYTYAKFLAWEIEDKVRFIGQDYGNFDFKIVIDKLIPKELFYSEFRKLNLKLKKYVDKHNKLFEKFKLQEEFLQSLKWKFDTKITEKPQEYVCIDCINNKNSGFELFQKNIKEKSKKHTVDWDTHEELFCYKANEYYYWISDNKIYRKFYYTYKEKDIIRFLKSKDFEYKKGMSLTEIYSQLLDKGYYNVISCKYHDKKVEIYANGQVNSIEADANETKELEQLIRKLTKNVKDKENLTVRDLVHMLNDNIDIISLKDCKMKI